MRAAAIVMALLVVGLGAVCLWRGGPTLLVEGLKAGGKGGMQLLPLLAVVFLLAGFAEVLLPRDIIAHWLSDESGMRGIGIAWIAGVLTPGGGPVGLPLAAALMRSGAGIGVVITYVTSMSLLSFVRVPLELGTYGARVTFIRVLSCVVLPPLAGMSAQVLVRFVR